MIIGDIVINKKTPYEVTMLVVPDSGESKIIKANVKSTITYLEDPMFGDNCSTARIETCSFEDFCNCIEQKDNGQLDFTDDLMYIQGIAVD